MAATPQAGTLIVKGLKSGKTRSVDLYFSDVNAGTVKFDGGFGAAAGSPDRYSFPEDVIIQDYSMVTGTADTTKWAVTINGAPNGNILRYSIHLTTLANRPNLAIVVPAGALLGGIQLT